MMGGMADESKKDDALLGLGRVFELAQLILDNARADGTDYSREVTDTLESLDVALKEARGEYSPDRVSGSRRFELDVPDGTGQSARLLVDGEDLLRRLPVRRVVFDMDRQRAAVRLELVPMSLKLKGIARISTDDPPVREAAQALMLDWDELEDGEHAGDEHAVVEVPIELMRKLKVELDR